MNRQFRHLMALTGSLVLTVLLLGGGPARALDATDLSFYAPFDNSLDAVVAGGNAKPETTVGPYKFAPGVLGQAVVTGEQGKELSYAVDHNFPDRKGSLAVWVKLVDWGATAQNHLIISIPEKLLFYQAANSGGVHLEWPNIGGSTYSYPPPLSKDKFVHIVYTWGDGNVTLYGNGEYSRHVGMNQPPYFPASLKELPRWTNGLRFYLSNPVMTGDGKNQTILDELMLFNRPLDATEVKDLYRHMTAPLLETIASIGEIANAPKMDGVFSPTEWSRTAQMTDFVDRPFGNLSPKAVKANLGYDRKALYLAVRSPEGSNQDPRENRLEVQILVKDAKAPFRFVTTADRKLFVYRGQEAVKEETPWQASVSTFTGKESAESCFEVAIPWSSIGPTTPPDGTALKVNLLRRWSADYRDFASWADVRTSGASTNSAAGYGTILIGGKSPVLAMDSLGKLNYAQLELAGRIIVSSGADQALKAEVRLQPSDLKEYYDPKTLPGTKSYTGTQLILDRDVKTQGGVGDLRVTEGFSDTDINSLWLKVRDPAGKIIYQAQRPFVAQPPVIASVKTYPDHDRLEVCADVSRYRESPLETIRAEIELAASSGKAVKTAQIDKFESTRQTIDLPLAPLPVGRITVKATLWKGQTRISSFLTAFEKLAPGPWYGNQLGKDDIVIPPFTPVKVEGQSVSVWGRTYRWDNSLFPVRIASAGEDLLAGPMELVAGGAATGKPNPANVKIKERKKTRVVVECAGTIGGVPVTARHTIEYDGMCLTQLQLNPPGESRLDGLALFIPCQREQSTLYVLWPDFAAGAVAEKINPGGPPMNGKRTFAFENMVKAYNDQSLDGYYFDGGGPGPCKSVLHGDGWIDEDGAVQPSCQMLAQREFFKRLAVEFSKAKRPHIVFANINPCVVLPCYSFMEMGWSGEQFSTKAMPARDYNKLMTLAHFRAQFLGQQFGLLIQWLVMFIDSSIGRKEIDSVLELALVHGVGDLCLASSLGATENIPYIRSVLDAQDDFGVRRKDGEFLPYWKNSAQVTVTPADENLVCSIWRRPGKVLLVLANSTQEDQTAAIRLNPSALGLEGALKASDLISKEPQTVESGVVKANVAHSSWRMIVVEGANAGVAAVEQPGDFFRAVQKGDLARATEFLGTDSKLIKAKDEDGYTALHFAAYNNRKEMAAFLLAKGADVKARCRFGFTPLHLAADACYKEVVEALVAKGADANARDNQGVTPLHLAVSVPINGRVPDGYTETVLLLIKNGADVNAGDGFGRTPLHWLVNWHPNSSEKAMAELLIANGANVNAREKRGWTALRYATTKQYFADPMHPALAEVLRKHGGKE